MTALLQAVRGRVAGATLDAGCGDGETGRRIVEVMTGLTRLVLLDRDEVALEEARDQFVGMDSAVQSRYLVGDVTALPFADADFDTVLLNDVLHHTAAPQLAVRECARVLKPGGRLIVSEMISDGLTPAEQVGRDLHHLKSAVDRLYAVPHGPTLPRYHVEGMLEFVDLKTEWSALERCAADDPHTEAGRAAIAARLDFLETYLEHADGSDEYAALRREAVFLRFRMQRYGFAPAPELRIVVVKALAR